MLLQLLSKHPTLGLVHDDLANSLVLQGLDGHVARRLALDQFEGYGLLHDLLLTSGQVALSISV